MNAGWEQMVETWRNGGWVMGALAMVALITYATAIHLLMFLNRRSHAKVTDSDLRNWVIDPDRARGQIRELIRYSQDDVHSLKDIEGRFREVEAAEIVDVDRRLTFVNVMVVSAPLFGLLGTVLGMLLTFRAIGIGGGSTSEVIAKGISEALVATQTGMIRHSRTLACLPREAMEKRLRSVNRPARRDHSALLPSTIPRHDRFLHSHEVGHG